MFNDLYRELVSRDQSKYQESRAQFRESRIQHANASIKNLVCEIVTQCIDLPERVNSQPHHFTRIEIWNDTKWKPCAMKCTDEYGNTMCIHELSAATLLLGPLKKKNFFKMAGILNGRSILQDIFDPFRVQVRARKGYVQVFLSWAPRKNMEGENNLNTVRHLHS
jgi:hypothetical protein